MRRRSWIALASSAVAVALLATLAVLWPGYDAREVPPDQASIWVLQTGEGKRYARVNSDLGELDTVREVDNPSGIAQHNNSAIVFADGNQRFAPIDAAVPVDLDDMQNDAFEPTPAETVQVVSAGEWIAYLTANGDASVGRLGETPRPVQAPTSGDADTNQSVTVTGIGLSETGEIALVISETGTVVKLRATGGEASAPWTLPEPVSSDLQLAKIDRTWVLFDESQGTMWAEGVQTPIATGLTENALLQASSASTRDIVISDAEGLSRVGVDGSAFSRLADAAGTPARPVTVDGVTYAAWATETQGMMWSSADGSTTLDFAGLQLPDERQLEFMTNGSRAVLNEQSSGWVWSVPEGTLLPSSTQWRIDERTPEVTESSETERVLEPRPPVAEPDVFGVRAGRSAILPVLLNDHDPNEDVLSIVPEMLGELDPAFGTVTLTNNAQQLVVQVNESATGSATFTYGVTDGTASGGLNSAPATVTLTVAADTQNSEPRWCGVEDCLAEWPTLEVAPGDTGSVNVLDGWVDPEGDPLYLSGIIGDTDYGQIITLPDGTVTYRHPDPSDTSARTIPVEVIVTDARGAQATRSLSIVATPEPQLRIVPFAVAGSAGTAISLDFSEAVFGSTGVARLSSLTLLDDVATSPTITRTGLGATFSSSVPGNYLLQATVTDGVAEASAVVRVTVIDPAQARITTSPVTAFVRPGEDATVDVLPAVFDPAGDVLLLDDLDVRPEGNAELSVDVIGQRFIRVMGDTETGAPGTLGTATYRVSDGSGSTSRSARGEITFVLLPIVQAKPPIAVDDRVVVRAGEQIDIPVLDNDTAPAGSHVQLDPGEIVNEHDAGLAFATNRMVRYLAPDEPGQYSVTYQSSLLGSPMLASTARIHITVTGDEGNTAPVAPTLEGRVRAGQTVSIPFDPFGTDSDGDVPRLDLVVDQPAFGTASIAPEGDALIFTSTPGQTGQTRFSYRVRDQSGATGVGTVRVGVIDNLANPTPITYSDYVQVQVGAGNLVTVRPLDNDLDPSGTELKLTRVTPSATPGSAEYQALAERIKRTDTVLGEVVIEGGEELGTYSFEYSVENTNGDTARGLIVVKVVREQVPSFPRVQDTVLTAETMRQLSDGIDVMSGKVAWTGGETDALTMELWRRTPGFSASGWEIRGTSSNERKVVPFEVSGTTHSGETVTSYGFLRVPGTDDLALSLRAAYKVVEVKEDEWVEVNLAEAVRVPVGETLEVQASGVHASGGRADARCEVTQGLTLRYTAGAGAPWQDVCTIPVKLSVQNEYTLLGMQIRVIGRDPQPELRPATITVSPGDTQQYDLMNMVDWQGNDARPEVRFETVFSGEQFEVRREGSALHIRALDTAQPSRQEPVEVILHGPYESSTAPLILTVGRSPQTLPKGATVAADCSQAGGTSSCVVAVVGGPGEVNPFPNTPLKLASVSQPANCEGVSMSIEDDSRVRVNWREDLAGAADCRASFTVTDAQGRSSSGERAGQLLFGLQGLPANPTRLEWVAFGADSVTLRPVSERQSIPQVTEYEITGGGSTQRCAVDTLCKISGLTNGTETEFTARAINSVGESRGVVSVTAWAYQAPQAPKQVTWAPLPNAPQGGIVSLDVEVTDRSTASVTVKGPEGVRSVTVPVESGRASLPRFELGRNEPTTLTFVPNTAFQVPPSSVGAGKSTGTELVVAGIHGVGAPGLEAQVVASTLDKQITVTVTGTTPQGASVTEYGFAIARQGSALECTPSTTDREQIFTVDRHGIDFGERYSVAVCARHIFEGQSNFGTTTWTQNDVRLEIPTPAPATYTVGPGAIERAPGEWIWPGLSTTAQAADGYMLEFVRGGQSSTELEELLPEPGEQLGQNIVIRNCLPDGSGCSPTAALSATGASASPLVVFESLTNADGYCAAEDLRNRADVSGLPGNAYRVENIVTQEGETTQRSVSVRFPGLGLDPVFSIVCEDEPPPPPEPEPEPDPEPEPEPDPDPDPGTDPDSTGGADSESGPVSPATIIGRNGE